MKNPLVRCDVHPATVITPITPAAASGCSSPPGSLGRRSGGRQERRRIESRAEGELQELRERAAEAAQRRPLHEAQLVEQATAAGRAAAMETAVAKARAEVWKEAFSG